MTDEPLRLPPGYSLDESDPDVLVLRRPDGTTAAVFSALGATPVSIQEAAWEEHGGASPADRTISSAHDGFWSSDLSAQPVDVRRRDRRRVANAGSLERTQPACFVATLAEGDVQETRFERAVAYDH